MKNLIVYISMGIFLYLYSYFLGGDNTMLMIYMLIFALLISTVTTLPLKGRIEFSIDAPTAEVEKGGVVKVNLNIHNKSFLPIPFIDVSFLQSNNFSVAGSSDIRFSLGSGKKKTVSIEYIARTRGVSRIGLESLLIRDYLGFFKVNLTKRIDLNKRSGEVTVIPRLYNIKLNSKIMQNTSLGLMSEENSMANSSMFTFTGEPGYEFREYVAGDPLHKIHWKLSAKKDTFMVRKDEGRGIPKKCLIVDPGLIKEQTNKRSIFITRLFSRSDNEQKDDTIYIEEKILEAMLAVAHGTVMTSTEAEIWLYVEGQWQQFIIRDKKNISEIQNRLAAYDFVNSQDFKASRLPIEELMEKKKKSRDFKGGEVIVFSGLDDGQLQNAISDLNNNKYYVNLVLVKAVDDNVSESKLQVVQNDQSSIYEVPVDMDISEAFI
ncbi:MAG: DUF58 domain-containing protein [Bacillota bacterium]|nr:DUF58 domain-containing protein [Bacillota bacterium]